MLVFVFWNFETGSIILCISNTLESILITVFSIELFKQTYSGGRYIDFLLILPIFARSNIISNRIIRT